MPPPEPRSSTTSPACRSASAVGLPQPREASTAWGGSTAVSAGSYRLLEIGPQCPPPLPPLPSPQQPSLFPVNTLSAAWPYLSRTESLIASPLIGGGASGHSNVFMGNRPCGS